MWTRSINQRNCFSHRGGLFLVSCGLKISAVLLFSQLALTAIVSAEDEQPVSSDAAVDESSLDFLKDQLARSRAAASSSKGSVAAAHHPTKGEGAPANLDAESDRLKAEESALLDQLAGGSESSAATSQASAPLPAVVAPAVVAVVAEKSSSEGVNTDKVNATENTVVEHVGVEKPPTRASADIAKALSEMEQLRGGATDQNNPIEIVRAESRRAPARGVTQSNSERPSPDISGSSNALSALVSGSGQTRAGLSGSTNESAERSADRSAETLSALNRTNSDLRRQLELAQRKIRDASHELAETRNRLIIAETEVERLSSVIQERNRTSLTRLGGGALSGSQTAPAREYRAQSNASANASAGRVLSQSRPPTQAVKATSDMLIGTVTAQKAYLRTGPGKNNSPLMSVSQGMRLAIETRTGEWYRVITPTGARAWVSSDVISFGPDNYSGPTRTVRTSGYVQTRGE